MNVLLPQLDDLYSEASVGLANLIIRDDKRQDLLLRLPMFLELSREPVGWPTPHNKCLLGTPAD